MKPIFITATGTNVGKTYTALLLIERLSLAGKNVGVFKPIETGVCTNPKDATLLLQQCQKYNHNFAKLTPKDITAYTFELPAAPYCADDNNIIQTEHILMQARELQSLCDVLIIEGAGGLMVPITKNYTMADLAREVNGKTLLVTPSKLGCINETMQSIIVAKHYELDMDWCVNLHEDSKNFDKISSPYYDDVYPDWWSLQNGLDKFAKSIIIN